MFVRLYTPFIQIRKMLKKLYSIFVFICVISWSTAQAAVIRQSLYINRGLFETVIQTKFPYIAFNSDRTFSAVNTVINLKTTDQLIVTVINTDSVPHGFDITNHSLKTVIAPADSITDTLLFDREGVFIYYDSYAYPNYRYLGEAGMICVDNSISTKKFYWNLKEHQVNFNEQLVANKTVSWSNYSPDFFTINSYSFPYTMDDTTAVISAKVGDTVRIFVANTGQSAHSIHFHGFHCKVIQATREEQIGWEKDTFPIRSMETIVLELVPDKPGHYSVHDHNLTAVTGAGLHPKGMLVLMAINN